MTIEEALTKLQQAHDLMSKSRRYLEYLLKLKEVDNAGN